jgi:DNA-directed RNA polymerase II subunit RPB1
MSRVSNYGPSIIYESSITAIDFYISGTKENAADSHVQVKTEDVLKNRIPQSNGVYDARMGSTDHGIRCQTCQNNKELCPGHGGKLVLKYPVMHPLAIKAIMKWAKITCFECGYILADTRNEKTPVNIQKSNIGKASATIKKYSICPRCSTPKDNLIRDKNNRMAIYRAVVDGKVNKQGRQVFPHELKAIFEKIQDKDVIRMGHSISSHPKKFLLDVIRVPPNTTRPEINKIGGGRSSVDDLTQLIQHVIKVNHQLPTVIPDQIDETTEYNYNWLNICYYEMIVGSSPTSKKISIRNSSKGQIGSIVSRWPRKEGRIRRNLMGRRVTSMGRQVITCDNSIKINEVRIPMAMARTIQVKEIVQEFNKRKLMRYFKNGKKTYPGCTKVIRKSTRFQHDIEHVPEDFELEIGDTLLRDVITGDYGYYNRQPSLWPTSILAHRIVVYPYGYTFRMNLLITPCYNADFDGDEMNLAIARTVNSITEIHELSDISKWFNSSGNSSPMIGLIQDSLIGGFEFSRSGVQISRRLAMRIFANTSHIPILTKASYSGRELISMVLPKINMRRRPYFYNKSYVDMGLIKYNEGDDEVVIDKGEFKSGILDKKTVGPGAGGGVFAIIHNEYGAKKALEVAYDMQQMIHTYLLHYGYSVGYEDMVISDDTLDEVHKIESGLIYESYQITEELNAGRIIPPIGQTVEEFYETKQINALSPGDLFIEAILKDIDPYKNALYKLIMSGSKGKPTNLYSITSAIGQMTIQGNRAAKQFGYERTLPYYSRFDPDPKSRGYVTNSYLGGIDLVEFIFHAQEARHALINNALNTAVTGERSRKSVKNLESTVVDNRRRVVKGDNIVQFIYGGDNFDTRKLEKVVFPTIMSSDKEFAAQYHAKASSFKGFNNKQVQSILDEEFETLTQDRNDYRGVFLKIEKQNISQVLDVERPMPINMKRMVDNFVFNNELHKKKSSEIKLNPVKAIETVKQLCLDLPYVLINEIQKKRKMEIPLVLSASQRMIHILIRAYLCSENLRRNNIDNDMLELICRQIEFNLQKALVNYGSSVGVIAAQSISEPLTQMQLDSKHRSGGAGTKTDNVTRINEIFGAKENTKNPQMMIPVKPEYMEDLVKVQEIANYIEEMPLIRFVVEMKVFYETYGNILHPAFLHEKKMIKMFERHNPSQKIPRDLAKWCIRLVLNKSKMILKNMKMEIIYIKLRSKYPDIHIVYSAENADEIIMRIYLRNSISKTLSLNLDIVLDFANVLLNTIIRGVPGITNTNLSQLVRHKVAADGSLEQYKENIIVTDGTNIDGVIDVGGNFINRRDILTDSIIETEFKYGIEAAGRKIINEVRQIMGGDKINHRHYTIFADEMCRTGKVTSIERTGLSKRERESVMLRLSTAAPRQVIEEAALAALRDELRDPASQIMVGQIPRVGTKYNQLFVNERFVKEHTENIDDLLDAL